MQRVIFSAVSAMLFIFLAIATGQTQEGLPYGSYQQTCRDISYDGTRLSAACQKVDGGWRNTSLDSRDCQGGQIINDDGYLRCGGQGGYGRPQGDYQGGWQGNMPYGTYRQTCRDISYNGSRISARCQKADGGWRNTSLEYGDCRGGQVINIDGHLRCGGQGDYDHGYGRPEGDYPGGYGRGDGAWRGGLPPGDYKRTCQNMHVEGNRLYAACQRVNGNWHDTSLSNFDLCRSAIVNDNGNLRCPK